MSSVDRRVIELVIEDDKFEKGVSSTIKSLDALDDRLNKGGASSFIETLSNGLNAISFSPVVQGIAMVGDSIAGIIGGRITDVISKIGTLNRKLLDIGNTLVQMASSGGLRRALNLDQAKFQIENLKVAYDDLAEDVSYGINGTPYSTDSAVKAAAQFLAAGVQYGTTADRSGLEPVYTYVSDMGTALRAISGVAVQTNSSFEDIAHTFAGIAGLNRVMGDDLLSLGNRGLAAAQALADYYNSLQEGANLTQADIKAMVSDGKVNFADFIKAMDQAFGEGATNANSTYEGVLANMKAAISRIGYGYMEPYVNSMKVLIGSAKAFFLAVRKGLDMTVPESEEFVSLWGYASSTDGSNWGGWSSFRAFEQNFNHVTEEAGWWLDHYVETGLPLKLIQQLLPTQDAIMHSTAEIAIKIIDTLGYSIENAVNSGAVGGALEPVALFFWGLDEVLFDVIPKIGSILNNLGSGILNILSIFQPFIEAIGLTGENFQTFIQNFEPLEGILGIISDLTGRLSSFFGELKPNEETIGKFVELVSAINSTFEQLMPSFEDFGLAFENSGFDLLGDIPVLLDGVAQFIMSILAPAIEIFGQTLSWAMPLVTEFASNFKDYFTDTFFDIAGLGDIFKGWADSIGQGLGEIANLFKESSSFEEFLNNFDKAEGKIGDIGAVFGVVASAVGVLLGGLGDVITVLDAITGPILGTLFKTPKLVGDLLDGIKTVADELTRGETLMSMLGLAGADVSEVSGVGDVISTIGEKVEWVKQKLIEFKDIFMEIIQDPVKMTEMLTKAWTVLSGVISAISFASVTKFMVGASGIPKSIKAMTESIGGIADSIAEIPEKGIKILGTLDSISTNFFDTLNSGLKTLDKGVKVENIKKVAEAVLMLAAALAIIAVVVKLLKPEELAIALGTLAGMLLIIGAALGLMTWLANKALKLEEVSPQKLASISTVLASLAAVIVSLGVCCLMLAAAMLIISLINPSRYQQALGAIMAILLMLVISVMGISAAVRIAKAHTEASVVGEILAMTAVIMALATAILLLLPSIVIFGIMPEAMLAKGLLTMALLLLGLSAFLGVVGTVASGSVKINVRGLMTTFLGMIPLLITMALIAKYLADPALNDYDWGRAALFLVGFMAMMSVFTFMSSWAKTGGYIGLFGAFLGLAVVLLAIVNVFKKLMAIFSDPELNPAAAKNALTTLGIMLIVITLFTALMAVIGYITDAGGAVRTVAILLAVCLVLVTITATLAVITGLAAGIGTGMVILAGALVLLLAVLAIFFAFGSEFLAASIVLLVFSASIAAFGAALYAATYLILQAVALLATLGPAIVTALDFALRTMAEHAPSIAENFSEVTSMFMRGVSEGISDASPEIGASAVNVTASILSALGANAGGFVQRGLEFILNLGMGIMSMASWAIQLVLTLGAKLVVGLAEGFYQNSQIVGVAVGVILESIAMAILSFLKEIVGAFGPLGDLLEGTINDMSDHVDAALANAKEQISENEAGLKKAGEEAIAGINEGAENAPTDGFEAAGENGISSLLEGMGYGAAGFDFSSMLSENGFNMDTFGPLGTENGEGLSEAFGSGFGDYAETSFPSIATSSQSELTQVTPEAENSANSGGMSLGRFFGFGYAEGIRSGECTNAVQQAVQDLVNTAVEAAHNAQVDQSPSHVAQGIGEYFGLGYGVGITNTLDFVANSAVSMVDAAKTSVMRSIDGIWDTIDDIDWDLTPTISPVVDLDNVYAAGAEVGRVFGRNSSLQGNYVSGAYRTSSTGNYYSNRGDTINIALQYDAGADATALVMDMARAIKTRSLTKG